MRVSWVVWVVVAGCGRIGFDVPRDGTIGPTVDAPPPMFVPPWHSGTRIRARVWRAASGDPIFGGWHDMLLDTDCESAPVGGGVERCVPRHVSADRYFQDAGCATPVLVFPDMPPCGKDAYANHTVAGVAHVIAKGAPYHGTVYEWDTTTSSCVVAFTSAPNAYQLGAEQPSTMFAQTSYPKIPVAEGVRLQVAFDDATLELGVLGVNDITCEPDDTTLGTAPCHVTVPVTVQRAYRDASCSDPPIYVWADSGGAPVPTVVATAEPRLCSTTYTALRSPLEVALATYYTKSSAGCTAHAVAGERLLDASAMTTTFPTGTVAPTANTGAIGHLAWTAGADLAFMMSPWLPELGVPCSPYLAIGGTWRCLPTTAKPIQATTAACTGALEGLAGACYGPAAYAGAPYVSCEDTPRPVTLELARGTAYAEQDGTCTAIGDAFSGSTGVAIDPAMFPALTESIE